MDKTWLSIGEALSDLGDSLSSGSPLSSTLSWFSGRYAFERAEAAEFLSHKYGPHLRLAFTFSNDPTVVPDQREVDTSVKDMLFRMENPAVDAYAVIGARFLVLIVYKSLPS